MSGSTALLGRPPPVLPSGSFTATFAGGGAIPLEAMRLGATDFLTLPIDLPEAAARTINLLALRQARLQLQERQWRTLHDPAQLPCPQALLH